MADGPQVATDDLDLEIAQLEEAAAEIKLRLTALKRRRAAKLAARVSAQVRRERTDVTARRVYARYVALDAGRSAIGTIVAETGLNERTAYRLLYRGAALYASHHPQRPPDLESEAYRIFAESFSPKRWSPRLRF